MLRGLFSQRPARPSQEAVPITRSRTRKFVDKSRASHSQGKHDRKLLQIFAAIGTSTRSYVEFGYTGRSTSNTIRLKQQGWHGLLLDGTNDDPAINLHAEPVSSANIVSLFNKYGV